MIRVLLLIWALAAASAPAFADELEPPRERVRYGLTLSGVDGALRDKVQSASRLYGLRDRAPYSDLALARRADADMTRLVQLLESEGYYDGRARYAIDHSGERPTIAISIDPGPLFRIARIDLVVDPDGGVPAPVFDQALASLAVLAGQPARAADVIAAEDAAVRAVQSAGFPLARRADRKLTRDPVAPEVAVSVRVEAGPAARFGRIDYTGLERTQAAFLDSLVPWAAGAPADPALVEEFAAALRATNVFGSVTVDGAVDGTNSGDAYDLAVTVHEAEPRTISAGASFSRDKGPGGTVGWSHRNLLGRGERLNATLQGNELEQVGGLRFAKPAFLRRDQTLDATLELRNTNADAFEEKAASTELSLSRKFPRSWIGSVGVGAEIARLEDATGRATSYLVSLPLRASRDLTDDLLDPTSGHKFAAEAVPYLGSFAGTASFVRGEASASAYRALDADRAWVVAARTRVGSVVGQSLAVIPQNQRLYAGGGGSVRGFDFQFVGPLNVANDPTGGRSVVEVGIELRAKISPTFGVVPFVDAGAVSASSLPLKDATVRYGAGVGLRYFTDVGPLRLDLAVPLNRRRGIDPGFQFYISFGQAF
ncbi:MAG: autotransporter assembly complex family protein [Rhodospirillaceae bacterium]|nr:autotransporter assembly complex family protein [Rhodospirillaceae bacterium]